MNGSFRDPVGLVRRMVRAQEPAARSALARAALEVIVKPIDFALARRERRLLEQAPSSDAPMLLVVGPPRSGTTVVYQTLVQRVPVSFATNLSALFPRAPISAQEVFARRAGGNRTDLRSYFGQTRGLLDANDAFHLWDRWLGTERYRAPDQLPADAVQDMRRFFDAWRWRFPAPFVNKNNRNTDCVEQLALALPEARFLVVRRDPLETLQSLLMARRVVQGDVQRGWGLRSHDARDAGTRAAVEAVCEQLVEIDRRLQGQLATIEPRRILEVSYAAFCTNPDDVVSGAAALIGVAPNDGETPPITHRIPHELSITELEWADACLDRAYRRAASARSDAS